MKKAIAILVAAIAGLSACRPFEEQSLGHYDGIPAGGLLTNMMRVSYRASTDKWFGGDNSKAFKLTFENASTTRISKIIVRIDESFTNSLGNMLFYFGFVKGNSRLERDYLEPQETITYTFSHDASNHGMFRNEDGKSLSSESLPQTIDIDADMGTGKWKFK